uniref:F-box domain-containing protein n=1 Tax=Steinernema glaseri TaxID=37863 RepID=A0A1I8A201_9BILA
MDAVPRLFIERWGKICTTTAAKVHTLHVLVESQKGKLYAAAQPVWDGQKTIPPTMFCLLATSLHLESVDLKFITNFCIQSFSWSVRNLSENWKEITTKRLQELVRFIKPTTERRDPVRHNFESSNLLDLAHGHMARELISMRPPVDSILLLTQIEFGAELHEFLESAGPLYSVTCVVSNVDQRATNAIIDKFVPVNNGVFCWKHPLSRGQLEELVLKCDMSNKKVSIRVRPEASPSSVEDVFDFHKYYSKVKIERRPEGNMVKAVREGATHTLSVYRDLPGEFEWRWDLTVFPGSVRLLYCNYDGK